MIPFGGFGCRCGTWLNDERAAALHICPPPTLTLDNALIEKIAEQVAEILDDRERV